MDPGLDERIRRRVIRHRIRDGEEEEEDRCKRETSRFYLILKSFPYSWRPVSEQIRFFFYLYF